ncbi:MAG: cytochrome-c peroxidase [Blastocatellia bacterium]
MRRQTHIKVFLVLITITFGYFTSVVHGSSARDQTANTSNSAADDAQALRAAIIARVGSLDKLRVPSRNEDLPQPALPDGSIDPRFAITEAKRYLGKQLYFDPVRMNRIRPEFGGDLTTIQTASCGSCHLGEVAGKAGLIVNLAQGAEGRGYMDAFGRFHVRRRLQLGKVDVIPTGVQQIIDGVIIKDGRFDAVDSVPRLSPSMIGFGFNTRLLLGGKAGQPAGDPNNLLGLPAGENLAQIAFDAHRMLETQKNALQQSPVYIKLFQDAFPQEAAKYAASGNLDDLINDDTVIRAVATFPRTVVTRNTTWDSFLAGDDKVLTGRQLRGALLFVRDVAQGGANCISCHSGPMLNKQLGDEAGRLVEENFYNLGVGDHPLRELARQALGDPNRRDIGRGEITGRAEDNFKFRVLTLRQLKGSGGQLMHSALFTSVREVVEYFNKGVPEDPLATAAGNVTQRFTHPRGPNSEPGLGLNPREVDDLVDFLENAIYDPAFVKFDPNSTTDTFELNAKDLTYSANRPDLAALGAIDGLMASGLCVTSNDPLTRREFGLEFLDVSSRIQVTRSPVTRNPFGLLKVQRLKLLNISSEPVDTHLLLCFKGLPSSVKVVKAEGVTINTPAPGLPYLRVFLPGGELLPGSSATVVVSFSTPLNAQINYTLELLSGQGRP